MTTLSNFSLKRIGSLLCEERLRRNDNQQEFAMRLGVSRHSVGRMESGDPGIRIESWVRVVMLLNQVGPLLRLFDAGEPDPPASLDSHAIIKRMGSLLADCRKHRKENQDLFAARLVTTRKTLSAMELGHAGANIAIWIEAFHLLGQQVNLLRIFSVNQRSNQSLTPEKDRSPR